jgi:hypothetical protein
LALLRAKGLQFSFEAEETAVAFLPVPVAEEVPAGRLRPRSIPTTVSLEIRGVPGTSTRPMQPPSSLAIAQIGSGNGVSDVFLTEAGDAKPDRHASTAGGEAHALLGPIECVGVDVVADRTLLGLGTFHRFKDGNLSAHLLGFGHAFGVGRFLFSEPG